MIKIEDLIAKIKEMAERPDAVAWGNREYYVALSIIEAAIAELESGPVNGKADTAPDNDSA